jgi:hypothetical protein
MVVGQQRADLRGLKAVVSADFCQLDKSGAVKGKSGDKFLLVVVVQSLVCFRAEPAHLEYRVNRVVPSAGDAFGVFADQQRSCPGAQTEVDEQRCWGLKKFSFF